MANDPLPLPDISAGSPDDPHRGHDLQDAYDAQSAEDAQDAEYEAIHAEIAATERGRWFLSEHVKRNRAADTDRLVGSLARAEAALRGGAVAAMPNPLADDLAQLAAAIGQVEAVIAAGAAPAAGGLAASERIQDIAFALRERETNSVLCEALESALFELGEAFAQHDAAAERAQSAAALLRGLQASINAMIALAARKFSAPKPRAPEPGSRPGGWRAESSRHRSEAWRRRVRTCGISVDRVAPPDSPAELCVRAKESSRWQLEDKPASEGAPSRTAQWEAARAPDAEMPAARRSSRRATSRGDTSTSSRGASERTAGKRRDFARQLSGEAVPDEEPSRASLPSEAAASEQQRLTRRHRRSEAARQAATATRRRSHP